MLHSAVPVLEVVKGNQLVQTEQSGIISLSSGFGEDLSGDESDVETQQQGKC